MASEKGVEVALLAMTEKARPLVQACVVVRDIEEKLEAWSRLLGVPLPEIRLTGTLADTGTTYDGEPSEARCKLAFFEIGGLSLELIEPLPGPSVWRDFLERNGGGLQHIGISIARMTDAVALAEAEGMRVKQQAEFVGGRYVYLDSERQLGAMLELLEFDEAKIEDPEA
jgi:methylmalonyl-CoA/ethylmalonyl-CoA epimerase